jgi:cytochrome c5
MNRSFKTGVALKDAITLLPAFVVLLMFQPLGKGAGPAVEVKDVYGKKCAVCHGPDGAAKTAKGRKSKTKDVRLSEVQKMSDQ